jgi:hypothetical protein
VACELFDHGAMTRVGDGCDSFAQGAHAGRVVPSSLVRKKGFGGFMGVQFRSFGPVSTLTFATRAESVKGSSVVGEGCLGLARGSGWMQDEWLRRAGVHQDVVASI